VSNQDFDNLTAALADRSISRRRALKMAAASALGAVGLGVAAGEAQAAPTCPRRGAGCDTLCRNTNKECSCIRTVRGDRVCVYQCCTPNYTEVRGCNGNGNCRGAEVCMRSDCCPTPAGFEGVCVRRCDRSSDFTCEGEVEVQSASGGAWS